MRRLVRKSNGKEHNLIVHDSPKSVSSEAFRTLRTNLQFTSPDRELKTVLVTSAAPDDGKSTVTANLAIAWAQSGSRVVLVDCDLRKPVQHKIFGLRNSPGLTGYLTVNVPLEEVILPSRIMDGLDLIPAGPIPPNPAELLQSKRMRELLAELRGKYDYVLCDAAPTVAVTDAAVLTGQVDGTVLVIRHGGVPNAMAQQAKSLLENANGRILGVVLNRIPLTERRYQYYYYQYGEAE